MDDDDVFAHLSPCPCCGEKAEDDLTGHTFCTNCSLEADSNEDWNRRPAKDDG